MSPNVILNFDFESWLILHAKRGKLTLTFFTICLKKCNFLQITSNIGKLYLIGKHFFFVMSTNLGSLPLNSSSIGPDLQ